MTPERISWLAGIPARRSWLHDSTVLERLPG